MAELEIEGKTVEEAIDEGLSKLGVSKENANIKILNEGTSGLFGLMGNKAAKIRISAKGNTPGSDTHEFDAELVHKRITEITADLFKLMSFDLKSVKIAYLTGRFMAEIKSDDNRLVIGKNGVTLDALEFVINLILNKDEKTRVKVSIDIEGYRQKQEERIQVMAKGAADEVKRTGKPHRFDSMNSKDRRIVHITLKSDTSVETVSEGEGRFRRVIIKPAE